MNNDNDINVSEKELVDSALKAIKQYDEDNKGRDLKRVNNSKVDSSTHETKNTVNRAEIRTPSKENLGSDIIKARNCAKDSQEIKDKNKKKSKKVMSKRKEEKRKKRKGSYLFEVIRERENYGAMLAIQVPLAIVLDLFRIIYFIFRSILVLLFFTGIAAVVFAAYLWFSKFEPIYQDYYAEALEYVENSTEETFRMAEPSFVYDSSGQVLAKLKGTGDSEYLEYSEIPSYAVDAFVAVEDRTFWENEGFDLKGIIRVAVQFVKTSGDEMHGASTITQQLARNVFLTHEVSIERKAKELLVSYLLTQKYEKEQIMEFYINDICYANGIYGLQAASLAYFNKDADELSLSQIAYLCAIPNSPTYYDPYVHPERAIERRDKILDDMLEEGYITRYEYDKATAEEIVIEKQVVEFNNYQTTYAVDCAVRYLMKLDGFEFQYVFRDDETYNTYMDSYEAAYADAKNKLYTGGYNIYTTLNSEMQETMQEILDNNLAFDTEIGDNGQTYALQGAVAVINNDTGKVEVVVGGRSQEEVNTYGINRAYQGYRQPGSSIKPLIVYAPALEKGYRVNSVVQDIDVTKAKEKGVDVQSLTGNAMPFSEALIHSRNGVAWQIFDKITPEYGIQHITDMNYSKIVKDDYYNSAALGGFTYGVTVVEQASGYSTLVNHGIFREATCISHMYNRYGEDIYKDAETKQVYKASAADTIIDILQQVPISGTAAGMKWSSSSSLPIAVKTGTTNDSKDGWLCGASPYYSMAVWVGYDTPRTLNNLWGSTYPAQIWKECMLAITEGLEARNFEHTTYEDEESDIVMAEDLPESAYENYLPGRQDDELLSENYYVYDYRKDRVVGEQIYQIVNQMRSLNMNEPSSLDTLNSLNEQGQQVLNQIYSRNYTNEMSNVLRVAYEEMLSSYGIMEVN